MKKTNILLFILFIAIALFSCSNSDDTTVVSETVGLTKVTELSNTTHSVELYTKTGTLAQGYNAISVQIKDKNTNNYSTDASIRWFPIMEMTTMKHSCPISTISKTQGSTSLYNGFIIFQMASNDSEHWSLTVQYTIDGISYEVMGIVVVEASKMRTVFTFTGSDTKRYVAALIDPATPKVAVNDITVGLFLKEDMMSFPVVEDYTIAIDPRMPSMGNHSSPNNVKLVYAKQDKTYHGKLSLTMSGYWKINLKILNKLEQVVGGGDVSAEKESSNLFFEIEF